LSGARTSEEEDEESSVESELRESEEEVATVEGEGLEDSRALEVDSEEAETRVGESGDRDGEWTSLEGRRVVSIGEVEE
jgi:hypothetical protein